MQPEKGSFKGTCSNDNQQRFFMVEKFIFKNRFKIVLGLKQGKLQELRKIKKLVSFIFQRYLRK